MDKKGLERARCFQWIKNSREFGDMSTSGCLAADDEYS